MTLGELLIVALNIHIQLSQFRHHLSHMQALSTPRSLSISRLIIIGLHLGLAPLAIGSGNIGYEVGGSDFGHGAVMREKAWAAIPQYNWDREDANTRPGEKIQESSIVSIRHLGFIGLKFYPLPSRTSNVIITVPMGCILVFNNEIRARGRWHKAPVL